MKRVIFVDDQPQVLRGLRRTLLELEQEWTMLFAESGEEALRMIAQQPVDVIVSDMRMPGMDGAVLLDAVGRACPHAVRIVLSGEADEEAVLRAVRPMHQYLSKPCDAVALKAKVTRACALRDCLSDDRLTALVSRVAALPSVPAVYESLMQELARPEHSIRRVGELISHDMGMTAKILQLVNSAAFGRPRKVTSAVEAVNLLGTGTIKALVISVHAFDQFRAGDIPGFSIDELMQHSLRTAAYARCIAHCEQSASTLVEQSFCAGMLHDLGMLILASQLPSEYDKVLSKAAAEGLPLHVAERSAFGVCHAEIGAYLLGLWGLPEPIVEAAAFHHEPGHCLDRGLTPLVCVHAANAIDHERHCVREAEVPHWDEKYLTEVGLLDRIDDWRAACSTVSEAE